MISAWSELVVQAKVKAGTNKGEKLTHRLVPGLGLSREVSEVSKYRS